MIAPVRLSEFRHARHDLRASAWGHRRRCHAARLVASRKGSAVASFACCSLALP